MPTVVKQTSKQVKAAYKKNDGRPSESEVNRLEKLAAADRRAEELREKERKKRENKKKREEKEKREREARRKNGLGDATQACGWNFTQHRQKNWFRAFLQKTNSPPENPYKSSPTEEPGNIVDELEEPSGNEEEQHQVQIAGQDEPIDLPNNHLDTKGADVNLSDDACEHVGEGINPAAQHETVQAIEPWDNDGTSDDILGSLNEATDGERPAQGHNSTFKSNPQEFDIANDNILLEVHDQVVAENKPVTEAGSDNEDEPWDLDDIDEAALLDAVQGQTPISKASHPFPASQDDGLPDFNTALSAESKKGEPTVHSPSDPVARTGCFSDSFMSNSSDFDITAEDLAAVDALCRQPPMTPKKSDPVSLSNTYAAHPEPVSLMPPPTKSMGKRRLETSESPSFPTGKQRKILMPKRVSAMNSMGPPPPPPKPPAGSPSHSRFADFGLSTQLLADAVSDDDIDF